MTEAEQVWVVYQLRLDAGEQHCEECDTFGVGAFCGGCGRRYVGEHMEWRDCPGCKVECATDWCPRCGERVASDRLRLWESGEIDLDAECEMASVLLEQLYRARPEMAPDHWRAANSSAGSLHEALMRAFDHG